MDRKRRRLLDRKSICDSSKTHRRRASHTSTGTNSHSQSHSCTVQADCDLHSQKRICTSLPGSRLLLLLLLQTPTHSNSSIGSVRPCPLLLVCSGTLLIPPSFGPSPSRYDPNHPSSRLFLGLFFHAVGSSASSRDQLIFPRLAQFRRQLNYALRPHCIGISTRHLSWQKEHRVEHHS